MYRARIIAQGFMDIAEKGADETSKVFKSFVDSVFPFLKKDQAKKDLQVKEMMEREFKKGVIVFNVPQQEMPLTKAAKKMAMPDDFRAKLNNRKGKRIVEI